MWEELMVHSPCSASLIQTCSETVKKPVLDQLPDFLNLGSAHVGEQGWPLFLNMKVDSGISNREIILRWLLSRAIVDQGSDIEGVEIWHHDWLADCYSSRIRILHDPISSLNRYSEVVALADKHRQRVTELRKAVWASASPGRHEGHYNPFNVDGSRGGTQAHWFVSARVLPAILASLLKNGGLTELVFGNASSETPSEMSRRLRNHPKTGLGYCMGDKATDLFVKWAVGTFQLGEGLGIQWTAEDCPLPMDQRIGRVLMRCGFMDEFFGVARVMSVASHGFTPPSGGKATRPTATGPIPPGRWHLTVKDFRRRSTVRDRMRIEWLKNSATATGATQPRRWLPQDVLSILCRAYNHTTGLFVTPVELDDYMMRVAETCRDDAPICDKCTLANVCQANNVATMGHLKTYIT